MKKLQVWLPLLFAIVMIVGMIIGFRLRSNIRPNNIFMSRKPTPVQEVMDLINMNYVDSISTDTIADGAIDGMLSHLDPHSVYIPPADAVEMNEDLQGNFEGIGVEFQIFDDTVNVMNVLAGGPSDKANLKVGDKFIKVGDSAVAGNGINNDRIRKLLRGPGSSEVTVTLLRVGNPNPIQVHITRGTIPLPSVDVAYMLNKETGYIRINRFSETTHAEFAQAMMQLQKQGLQRLVLDLRGNGGGILQESIECADDFLDGDKLIVYTVGARSPRADYRCRRDGLFALSRLGRTPDRRQDARIGAAAAEIGDRLIHLRVGGIGRVLKQGRGGHQHARHAITALRHILGGEGLLQGMAAIFAQPFDRSHERAFDRADRDLARTTRGPIDDHCAGTAIARTAAIFGAGQVRGVAQRPKDGRLRVHLVMDGLAVDGEAGHRRTL